MARHALTGLLERGRETFQSRSDFGAVDAARNQTVIAGEWRGEFLDRLFLTADGASTWVLAQGWAEERDRERVIFLKFAMSWPFRDVVSSGLAADFGLTRSEAAVLDQFASLKKPAQIAEQLQISVSTVRSHLKQIHAKMGVNSGVQLLRITRAHCDFL